MNKVGLNILVAMLQINIDQHKQASKSLCMLAVHIRLCTRQFSWLNFRRSGVRISV